MTVDPSALQTARLALAQIAAAWPQLAGAADTTLTRRTAVSVAHSGRAVPARDSATRGPTGETPMRTQHRAAQLHLAQATVALGVLLITLGVTIHLGAPWTAGWGIGLLAAWGVLSVPLHRAPR